MIFAFPAGMDETNWQYLNLEGTKRLIGRTNGTRVVEWMLGPDVTYLTVDFNAGTIELSDTATGAQVDELQAAINMFGQPPAWNAAARDILEAAQSAVGVYINDLTTAQRWALLAALMWDKKAIGNDLTVKPLAEWVVRKPADG